jgi:hypothetical protein
MAMDCAKLVGRVTGMANESEQTVRLQVLLKPDELAAIDDFRYSNRMPNRAAAVRELLRRGLASFPTGGGDAISN